MTCEHPIVKQKIWATWTEFHNTITYDKSSVKVVLECECGERTILENKIGDTP
jgi:hypothetical protein